MKKKAIIVVASVVVLSLAYFAIYGVRTTRPEGLQRLIAQNVRVGESSDEVIRFLDSRHFEHSMLVRMPEFSTLNHTYGDAPLILAIRRHTMQAWWGFESLQIIFVFGEDNRLLRFDMQPQYTSL
jgi:hypothetical protein